MLKLVTWNMQGGNDNTQDKWTKVSNFLLNGNVDVICLQECGQPPSSYLSASKSVTPVGGAGPNIVYDETNWGSSHRGFKVFTVWFEFGKTNTRCSLAVVCKAIYSGGFDLVSHAAAGLRPLVGLELATGAWVYSIHAPSGNHVAASKVANSLLNNIGYTPWVCAGDYNCSPADMRKLINPGWEVVDNGNQATQASGHCLDFLVTETTGSIQYSQTSSVAVSDHYSQGFDLN